MDDDLAAWIASNTNRLKLSEERSESDIRALCASIVHEFIVRKQLILYGGLSIDYALRIKGSAHYTDGRMPDYDFYSPNNVDDAYELADILRDAGLVNARATIAMHVNTFRVWVTGSSESVADISYVPLAMYKTLPTLEYDGMRIIHPDYQRMDIHIAHSFPFRDPPLEAVYQRMDKDVSTFNKLTTFYPMADTDDWKINNPVEITGGSLDIVPLGLSVKGGVGLSWERGDSNEVAIHGLVAYSLHYKVLVTLLETFGGLNEDFANIPIIRCSVGWNAENSDVEIGIDLPEYIKPDERIIVCSAGAIEESCVSNIVPRWMSVRPKVYSLNSGISIYSTTDDWIPVSLINVGGKNIAVSSIHYLLLYLLQCAQECHSTDRPEASAFFSKHYRGALDMLKIADDILAKNVGTNDHTSIDLINSTPFGISSIVMGDKNRGGSYKTLISRSFSEQRLEKPSWVPNVNTMPTNYYADKRRDHPTVDYNNEHYRI
jgi:hypothetical protein